MTELLELLRQVVHQVTTVLGYPGIFLLMLAENLFPPIPSEIVMPFAGFFVSEGRLSFAAVLIAGSLGSLAGAWIIYQVGAMMGKERLERWIDRYGRFMLLSACDLERALRTFERHGRIAVLLGRLIPGVRSLISLPAGINRMPMGMFLLYTTLGTLVWNTLLAGAGLILGQNWESILAVVETYETILWFGLGALALYWVVRRVSSWMRSGWQREEC